MTDSRWKTRDSNMELLRIIAMVFIMLVHANFRALHYPTADEMAVSPTGVFVRYLWESLFVLGVNAFVMLSGWYGIRFRLSRLWELLFQVLFFAVCIIAIACIYEQRWPVMRDLGYLLLSDNYDYWFVKAYLMLYILSPVLNAFVERASREQFLQVLLLFFGFVFLWGWIFKGAVWLKHGHSGIFFVGLYLLARYLRLYWVDGVNIRKPVCAAVYLSIALVIAVSAYLLLRTNHLDSVRRLYFYTCPLVIVQAAAFLLFFTQVKLKSKIVNWVAISTLAIYLVHSSPFWSKAFYDQPIAHWFDTLTPLHFAFRVVLLVFVTFWISIFADKVRIAIWQRIQSKFPSLA